MKQNTQEWLEMRKEFIGASDAPVIMGVSPWKTPFQLWQEKLGLIDNTKTSGAMKRGIELEPRARALFNMIYNIEVEPKVVFHEEIKFMMASLDGIDGDFAVEIKCPGKDDHNLAKQGIIPEKYMPQLQHQLAVLGINRVHYFSYVDDEDFVCIEVTRDEEYIQNLIEKEKEFWNCVRNFKSPELSNKDYTVRSDTDWNGLAEEYKDLSRQFKEIESQLNEIKDKLINLSGGKSCEGGGIRCSSYVKKGSIDYKAIPELQDVDLEPYRKKPSECWRISINGANGSSLSESFGS